MLVAQHLFITEADQRRRNEALVPWDAANKGVYGAAVGPDLPTNPVEATGHLRIGLFIHTAGEVFRDMDALDVSGVLLAELEPCPTPQVTTGTHRLGNDW